MRLLLFSLLIGTFFCSSCKQEIKIYQGEIINNSSRIKKMDYLLKSEDFQNGAITISGHNLVIDFNGATIVGDSMVSDPNLFTGVGIRIVDGSNITIKNLRVKGFKVGLLAENIPGLTIEDSDFSYNYRPRMKSIREREDLSDWLSYHDNEEDQWLDYGAGIYLKNCTRANIKNNFITQNQNALLLVNADSSTVLNNIFVFNSGLGIGLYRSSHNRIMHNCLDFNVRGYSHGIYRRGQDSAGALFYEQSSDNVFAYNSATHSGDGFFLYAGNETMESGEGGCNNNIIAHNDFSFAPTNGIEVTFSSNIIIGNKMVDCRYGIWGGYSYHTYISENTFEKNNFGIAIEHGNNNTIVNNSFHGDEIGIKLWQRDRQPSDWGFAQKRDVRSRDYHLTNNQFVNVPRRYDIENTVNIDSGVVSNSQFQMQVPDPISGGFNSENHLMMEGRDKILVNEWGPYNYAYPLLWLTDISMDTLTFLVLGPVGQWQVIKDHGISSFSHKSGRIGDTIQVLKDINEDLLELRLQYQGSDFIDQLGIMHSGNNYPFHYRRYDKAIDWEVSWYTFDDDRNPLTHYEQFKKLKEEKPDHSEKRLDLSFTWWNSPGGKADADRFGTFAKSTSYFAPGTYLVQITSDDGLRFYVDGQMKIDHWDIHVPATDSLNIYLDGEHQFEIEHFEGGGFSTLDFRIDLLGEAEDL